MDVSYYKTPFGFLKLCADEFAIREITFAKSTVSTISANPLLRELTRQLDAYFAGELLEFDIPYQAKGSEFQQSVWKQLIRIPFGSTCSYGDIAKSLGRAQAARAVGQANHRNPLPLLIPCHRVIGSQKSLTGYAGGLDVKEWLLEHEKKVLIVQVPSLAKESFCGNESSHLS